MLADKIALLLLRRARLPSVLLWTTIALVTVVLMAAQFSGRQPATVALDVGISFIRLALPLLMLLMVPELSSRDFDRRYYLISLTYPHQRQRMLQGRFVTIYALATLALFIMGAVLALEVWFIGQDYKQATPVALDEKYLLTLIFIALDVLVLTAMATFIAMAAATPSFVLIGTLGFMLIARSYSAIIALLHAESYLVNDAETYRSSLGILNYLLPDLGALDVRMVALYGKFEFLPQQWPLLLTSAFAYTFVLLALAWWVLRRKSF